METITRKLVLIRHAKAESRKKDKSDSLRELTRKGIEYIDLLPQKVVHLKREKMVN